MSCNVEKKLTALIQLIKQLKLFYFSLNIFRLLALTTAYVVLTNVIEHFWNTCLNH